REQRPGSCSRYSTAKRLDRTAGGRAAHPRKMQAWRMFVNREAVVSTSGRSPIQPLRGWENDGNGLLTGGALRDPRLCDPTASRLNRHGSKPGTDRPMKQTSDPAAGLDDPLTRLHRLAQELNGAWQPEQRAEL